jgi:lysophospholipase L1-like esterase
VRFLVRVNAPVTKSPKTALLSRPVLGVVSFLVLAGVCELVPGLSPLRLFRPPAPKATPVAELPPPTLDVGEATLETETHERPELAQPENVTLPKGAKGPIAQKGAEGDLPAIDAEKPPVPMQNTETLSGFYAALGKTIKKEPGAITRVVHFGDSIVTSDYVSGTLRRKLQKQFGDGGHGYMLMANAWPAYFHNDVSRFASAGWLVSRIVGPLSPDGLYGLGGVTFRAPPGSRARFGTAKSGSYGRAVSRFVVVYLQEPGGGTVELNVDGKLHSSLVTDAPEKKVAYQTVEVPDGEHELEVVTKKGVTRAFGVIMERDGPGIVLDAIGIQGARVRFLDKQDDAHWAEQLQSRKANLLIYEFGANESGDGFAYPMVDYNRTLKEVLRQGKKALPNAGCLIIGAMDRAEKKGTSMSTMAIIPALVKEQKQAAAEVGCAFFDTYEAMGGAGSMAAWVGRGLGQADLTHPSGVGSEVIGNWIYRALVQGYEEYRAKQK